MVNFSEAKDAGRCALIALFFSQTFFILAREPGSPGETSFSKQNRYRLTPRHPFASTTALKHSHLALSRIPIRRDPDEQLRTIVWNSGGMHAARMQDDGEDGETAESGDKHSQT